MNKFIKRLVYFALPLVIISYPLDLWISDCISESSCIGYCSDEFSVWDDIFDGKIDSDIAVYGSSRAWMHFDTPMMTDSLGHNSYNFGMNGNGFLTQYLRHKMYLKHNRKPKVIMLSVDYFTLEKRDHIINHFQFLPYMLWNKDMMEETSSYSDFEIFDFLIPLLRYIGDFQLFVDTYQITSSDLKSKRDRGFAGISKGWYEGIEETKEVYHFEIDEKLVQLLDKFLQECVEDDIEVVLVYAPIYYEGLKRIGNQEEIFNTFYDFSIKYNLEFLDYLDYEINCHKFLFVDFPHLNDRGAYFFTSALIEDFQRTKALKRLKRE
ncbi:MAG: hypothetical protein AB8B69_11630 [Chitinophagales bacterium]